MANAFEETRWGPFLSPPFERSNRTPTAFPSSPDAACLADRPSGSCEGEPTTGNRSGGTPRLCTGRRNRFGCRASTGTMTRLAWRTPLPHALAWRPQLHNISASQMVCGPGPDPLIHTDDDERPAAASEAQRRPIRIFRASYRGTRRCDDLENRVIPLRAGLYTLETPFWGSCRGSAPLDGPGLRGKLEASTVSPSLPPTPFLDRDSYDGRSGSEQSR